MTEQAAEEILRAAALKHQVWLETPLDRPGWLELLMRCQVGAATCMLVLEKIEADLAAAAKPRTPNASLPAIAPGAAKRKMLIEIEVAEDFENRLDNQWMVEREIHADRWKWNWAPSAPVSTPQIS